MTAQPWTHDHCVRMLLKHQNMLSTFVFALTQDWELVDEAVQETSVYVCENWKEFTPGTNFGAWTRSIARNRLREVLRARQRAGRNVPGVDVETLADPITDADWERYGDFSARRKDALAACMNALPANSRQVIDLHYAEQKPCEEIASLLKRSVDAIYKLLSRVRVQLRDCVEQRMAKG